MFSVAIGPPLGALIGALDPPPSFTFCLVQGGNLRGGEINRRGLVVKILPFVPSESAKMAINLFPKVHVGVKRPRKGSVFLFEFLTKIQDLREFRARVSDRGVVN